MTDLHTITVYTENSVSLLNQVTIVFTRRGLNIESITVGGSGMPGVHKFTITCYAEREVLEKVIKQIEKRIDVLRAFILTDEDQVYQEVALYKVSSESLLDEPHLESIIRRHGANILEITRDYAVIEKTGHIEDTTALFEELEPYGIMQFTRSGRVAVTKSPEQHLTDYVNAREAVRPKKVQSQDE